MYIFLQTIKQGHSNSRIIMKNKRKRNDEQKRELGEHTDGVPAASQEGVSRMTVKTCFRFRLHLKQYL